MTTREMMTVERVYLVDGTYELFRHYFAVPSRLRPSDGVEVGAVLGVVLSVLGMILGGATHVGVATDDARVEMSR